MYKSICFLVEKLGDESKAKGGRFVKGILCEERAAAAKFYACEEEICGSLIRFWRVI